MSLVRWNPFREIDNIAEDMNSFMNGIPLSFFNRSWHQLLKLTSMRLKRSKSICRSFGIAI